MSITSHHHQDHHHHVHRHADRARPVGWLSIGLVAILLLPLFYKAVSVAIADYMWSRNPHIALSFDPDLAKARQAYALTKLTSGIPDAVEAERQLKEALLRDPLAPSIVTTLAKTYVAQRQSDRARVLWPLAASSTWRDGEAQSEALQLALNAKNYSQALSHFDAMMRVFPGQNGKIAAFIVPYLNEPDFKKAFIALLMDAPPWRSAFLSALNQLEIPLARLNEIYAALKRSREPLTQDAYRPYIKRLVANKFYDNAYLIWLSTLPNDMKPNGALLYNQDFRFPVSHMPFDWSFEPAAGIDIEVEKRAFGRVLRVTFSHTRSLFQNVRQILFLTPGNYVFEGRESADMISNDRGVRWRIRCVNDNKGALAVTPSLTDTIPWRDFRVGFSVPLSCPVQEIILEVPARTGGERKTNGAVGYSNLSLQAAKPTPSEP